MVWRGTIFEPYSVTFQTIRLISIDRFRNSGSKAKNSMSYTYLLHTKDEISPIAASAEHWFALEAAETPNELETTLRKVGTDGWIHQIDVSPESAEAVIKRAKSFSEKLSVLVGPLENIVAEYLAGIAASDESIFFCLKGYDRPGEQLRRAAITRPPHSFTYHILTSRFPNRYQLDQKFAEFLDHLFIDQEFRYTLDELLDNDRSLHHRLYVLAQRSGIESLQRLVDSARAVRFAYGLIELGLTCEEAAEYCGGKHRQTIRHNCGRVLGTSSAATVRKYSMSDVVLRADSHMFIVGYARRPLPPLPEDRRR